MTTKAKLIISILSFICIGLMVFTLWNVPSIHDRFVIQKENDSLINENKILRNTLYDSDSILKIRISELTIIKEKHKKDSINYYEKEKIIFDNIANIQRYSNDAAAIELSKQLKKVLTDKRK